MIRKLQFISKFAKINKIKQKNLQMTTSKVVIKTMLFFTFVVLRGKDRNERENPHS